MWKESYRIGVDIIDDQHRELFRVTGGLLRTLHEKESENTKKECIDAISFLKNYAVEHFACEEKYQAKIKYKNLEEHKKLHEKFVSTVLMHEAKMKESDFSIETVKDFTGMLAAWLVYHVADEDQKYAKTAEAAHDDEAKTVLEIFESCSCEILRATAGLKGNEIKRVFTPEKGIKGEISFRQSFAGDIIGDITFVITKPLALKVFETMTAIKLTAIDTMVAASISELVDIINEKAIEKLCKIGYTCSVVASDMESGLMTFGPENSLGLYSLIGNMGVHDESVYT